MNFDEMWAKVSKNEVSEFVKPIAFTVWSAAIEESMNVIMNCEPDDHGRLSIQDIAEAVEQHCLPGN